MELQTDTPPERSDQPSAFAAAGLRIWLRPRATMRRILDTDPRAYVWVLAALGGMGLLPGGASPAMLSSPAMWIQGILLGALIGLVSLALVPFPCRWTGRWLGGEGTVTEIRSALAWSQIPAICRLPLDFILGYWVVRIHLQPAEGTPADLQVPGGTLLVAISLLYLVLGIWQFVITLKTVGEAQRFSAWRALVNLILTGLLIVLVVLLPLTLAFWFGIHPSVAA